jgi:hypothetical protein
MFMIKLTYFAIVLFTVIVDILFILQNVIWLSVVLVNVVAPGEPIK